MDLKLQYAILGLFLSGRYSYDKKNRRVTSNASGKTLKATKEQSIPTYRLSMGFDQTVKISTHKIIYLLHYGVVNPHGTYYFKDGDCTNIKISNIGFRDPTNRITPDIKKQIFELYAKGWWPARISRSVKVSNEVIKRAIVKEFGSIDPRQFQKNKKFYEAFDRDLGALKKRSNAEN